MDCLIEAYKWEIIYFINIIIIIITIIIITTIIIIKVLIKNQFSPQNYDDFFSIKRQFSCKTKI